MLTPRSDTTDMMGENVICWQLELDECCSCMYCIGKCDTSWLVIKSRFGLFTGDASWKRDW